MDINGLAAIVTDGASGLGGATAARLAKAGAKVATFDLNAKRGKAHAKAIGGRFAQVNVTDETAVEDAIAEAEGLNGKARVLENCVPMFSNISLHQREGIGRGGRYGLLAICEGGGTANVTILEAL
ncbi:MAG: SDR family NAD(P)-dependent oxidoreductase [Sphingomonas sp.]|nr:SDR family NAD(P)-dependent oxidoreductase [Sphingomonas sp.]